MRRGCCNRKLSKSTQAESSSERASGREASVHGNKTIARSHTRSGPSRVSALTQGEVIMEINVNDKLIYLEAGCGIGLVLGLLFAPQSGEEMRSTLTSKVDDLTHKVQEKVHESRIGDTAGET